MKKNQPETTTPGARSKIVTLELDGKTVYCFPAVITLKAKRTDKTTTP